MLVDVLGDLSQLQLHAPRILRVLIGFNRFVDAACPLNSFFVVLLLLQFLLTSRYHLLVLVETQSARGCENYHVILAVLKLVAGLHGALDVEKIRLLNIIRGPLAGP